MATRPIGRDYKNNRRAGFDFARWRDFAAGLAIGLGFAALIYVQQRTALAKLQSGASSAVRPQPQRGESRPANSSEEDSEAATQFDFYERLPSFEVVVPEREGEVQRGMAGAPIARPGSYVLQAGSYRNSADAERVRAQLGLQGISAVVQRVAVDADVWHRVRIGPSSDLTEVNRLRQKLRSADLEPIVIRVGE